jgi:chorismate lyase / 3-hydroxybenzoate synthase
VRAPLAQPAEIAAGPAIFQRLRPDAGTPVLAPAGGTLDTWFDDAATPQRHGCVRYEVDGEWLYGCAEAGDESGLQAAAHQAYTDLFQLLGASASPHLLRLWNYFPGINADGGGAERYRQFNVGRQQAFIEARRSAFEGSPAACALGTQGGPLRVYFLAGRIPSLAIENPRQVSAYRYPDAYGPRSPTFSRAALAEVGAQRTLLFISGTASIVGHTTMHIGDVRRQTEESLVNIAAVRAVAAARAGMPFPADALSYTVYVRRPADLALVREVFEQSVGAQSPAAREAIYLQADICRADLLVEIEAHGFARSAGAA